MEVFLGFVFGCWGSHTCSVEGLSVCAYVCSRYTIYQPYNKARNSLDDLILKLLQSGLQPERGVDLYAYLAKGWFVMESRAAVSMATCPYLEVEGTVDSANEEI